MDFDLLYSSLIFAAWLFLGGWVGLLVAASVAAFGRDQGEAADSSLPSLRA